MVSSRILKVVLAGVTAVILVSIGIAAGAAGGGGAEPAPAARAGVGSPSENTFVPITPCRIVNTQAGAKLAVGQPRSYKMHGNTSSQGGAAACGVPTHASALEVSVTAPQSDGNGYLRIGPAGQPIPTATFLNHSNLINLTNAGTVRVAPGAGNNLQVQTFVQATHVIVDVLGYFVSDLWAEVTANGTVTRGNGVVSAAFPTSEGIYAVRFDRNISACAISAVPMSPSSLNVAPPRMISVARAPEDDTVRLLFGNDDGGRVQFADLFVTVDC